MNMDAILNFDWAVFKWVEAYVWNPVLDIIMPFLTYLGEGGAFWIALGVCLIISKKYRIAGIAVLAALAIHLVFNDLLLKNLFCRPRPFNFEPWKGIFVYPNLIKRPSSLSFPSGHASSAFACATAITMTKKKSIYIPALVLAALISFSRLYLHVHYCTDVIAGIVVGIIYGILAIFIVKALAPVVTEKYKKNKSKRSHKNA